jgi:hypothetical protein
MMVELRRLAWGSVAAAALWLLQSGTAVAAETLWGLTASNTLVRNSSAAPGTPLRTVTITGLQSGEQMVAIEVEWTEGRLTGVSTTGRRYQIDRTTGAATQLAPAVSVITPTATAFGASDDGSTLMLAGQDGSLVLINKHAGVQDIWPGAPLLSGRIVGLAWRYPGTPQRIALDSATDAIAEVQTLNVAAPTLVPIGPLGVDTSDEAGLEFGPHDGVLYAALTVGGTPGLYTVNVSTGQATLVGAIAAPPIVSLTADMQGTPVITRVSPSPVGGYEVNEANVTLTFTVQRTGDDTVATDYVVRTDISAVPIAATPNQDFVPVNQTLHFAVGELEKSVQLTILADSDREYFYERVWLSVTEAGVAPFAFGAFGSQNIHILDDDNRAPVLQMVFPIAPATDVTSATVTLTGLVEDEDPGVEVRLFGPGGVPYIPIATTTGSPWTFQNVALEPGVNAFRVEVYDVHGRYDYEAFTISRVTGADQTYVLAEGATGTFFSTDLLLANPNPNDVSVAIDFLRADGAVVPHVVTVPAQQRTTVSVDAIPGLEATSTAAVVRSSGSPIVVERTMRWDASGYGASTEKAASALSRTWYFAEGAQGFFSTFLLLVNPQSTSNDVTVRFLRELTTPFTRTYTMAPRQRLTIDAGALPELVGRSFGIEVTFTDPGMAERAMYFGQNALWDGGHESAGAPAPATDWYLAEGSTGQFFETFILVANPTSTPAEVTFTFMPEGGSTFTTPRLVAPNSRFTLNIEQDVPQLGNFSAIGTRVTSDVPIVVERSQYWPESPRQWYEAHNSFGQTETALHWGLAEGRVGGAAAYKTYVMLTNADTATSAQVAVKFLREGAAPVAKTFTIAPASRLTIDVGGTQVPEIVDGAFGAEIVSSIPISVERAMYANANGQFWAAGTIATATRLP